MDIIYVTYVQYVRTYEVSIVASLDESMIIGASLSEPHTSDRNGTSDCLWTITIKHRKLINSSIDNLNYTKNS